MRKARIPNAVPYLFTALTIAAPVAVITAFVPSTSAASQNGLGNRITSNMTANTAVAWAYVLGRLPARAGVLPDLHQPWRASSPITGAGAPGEEPHEEACMRRRCRRASAHCVVAACGDDDDAAASTARRHEPRRRRTDDDAGAEPPREAPRRRRPAAGQAPTARRRRVRRAVDDVELQLQWVIQAQFAGYFAAEDRASTRRVPRTSRSSKAASTSCRSRCSPTARPTSPSPGCRRRSRPASRAPTSSTSPRSSSAPARCRCRSRTPASRSPADFAGKNIGNWGFGNEYEIFAALAEAGLDPATDVELVQQQFDMVGLLPATSMPPRR